MAIGELVCITELPEGELDETGKGLLVYGSRLAANLGAAWQALSFESVPPEVQTIFGQYGTPKITTLEAAAAALDRPELLAQYLAEYTGKLAGGIIVFAHNDLGATLAPVLAAALNAPLMSEVIAMEPADGGVLLSSSVLGRRLSETRFWKGQGFLVVTVPPQTLSAVNLPTTVATTPEMNTFSSTLAFEQVEGLKAKSARIVERIAPDPESVDLGEAEVIFCAGKGCDPTTFAQIEELCGLLQTSLGVTRPVYDLGWADFSRMIGQTGKTVKPKLYLTLGVSGAMHHVGGIQDAKRIVAVNIDAKAPIFPNADQGFVADVREVLPRLIEKIRAAQGEIQ